MDIYQKHLNQYHFYKNYIDYYEIKDWKIINRIYRFEIFMDIHNVIYENNRFIMNNYYIDLLQIKDIKRLYNYIFTYFDNEFKNWLNYLDTDNCVELLEIMIRKEVEKWIHIFIDILTYNYYTEHYIHLPTQRITTIFTIYDNIFINSNRKIKVDNYDGIATFLFYYRICIKYMFEWNSYYKNMRINNLFGENIHPDTLFDFNCEQLCNLLNEIQSDINNIDDINNINNINNIDDMDLSVYEYIPPLINNPKGYYDIILKKNIDNCFICMSENIECYICINKHSFSCLECSTKINSCPLCRIKPIN